MARTQTRVLRSRAPRRKTVWVGTADQAPVGVASTASVIISSFAPSDLSILQATAVRVRGLLQVRVDISYDGAYGLAVVSDEAFAAGAAAIPRAFDDDDWPGWLVHGYWMGHFEFDSSGSTNFPIQQVIDSKAMRKVGVNETLVWMVEARVGAVTVTLHARVLLMLA